MTEEQKTRIITLYTIDLIGCGKIGQMMKIPERDIREFLKEKKLMRSTEEARIALTKRGPYPTVGYGKS